jgi:hypothetical protein
LSQAPVLPLQHLPNQKLPIRACRTPTIPRGSRPQGPRRVPAPLGTAQVVARARLRLGTGTTQGKPPAAPGMSPESPLQRLRRQARPRNRVRAIPRPASEVVTFSVYITPCRTYCTEQATDSFVLRNE